jgi:hypothetical protein
MSINGLSELKKRIEVAKKDAALMIPQRPLHIPTFESVSATFHDVIDQSMTYDQNEAIWMGDKQSYGTYHSLRIGAESNQATQITIGDSRSMLGTDVKNKFTELTTEKPLDDIALDEIYKSVFGFIPIQHFYKGDIRESTNGSTEDSERNPPRLKTTKKSS